MIVGPAVIVLLAALASAALIVLLRPYLVRYALARPNARSSHHVPTPQGAGIAVILATLVVAGAAIALDRNIGASGLPALFAAAVLIAIVGAVDDVRPIPVLPRLLLQILAIGIVLVAVSPELRVLPLMPFWLERLLLLLAALWFINLVNFMDGLDWITVAEVVPITAALIWFGLLDQVTTPTMQVAAALCGAIVGFAPFNRPIAKVFLGDVGSLPIGLVLAWCLLNLAASGHLVAAVLLPLYYLLDATVTLLRRLYRREAIWVAHRTHFYQQATNNGFPVLRIVGEVFALNIALAGLAFATIAMSSQWVDILAICAGLGLTGGILMHFAGYPQK